MMHLRWSWCNWHSIHVPSSATRHCGMFSGQHRWGWCLVSWLYFFNKTLCFSLLAVRTVLNACVPDTGVSLRYSSYNIYPVCLCRLRLVCGCMCNHWYGRIYSRPGLWSAHLGQQSHSYGLPEREEYSNCQTNGKTEPNKQASVGCFHWGTLMKEDWFPSCQLLMKQSIARCVGFTAQESYSLNVFSFASTVCSARWNWNPWIRALEMLVISCVWEHDQKPWMSFYVLSIFQALFWNGFPPDVVGSVQAGMSPREHNAVCQCAKSHTCIHIGFFNGIVRQILFRSRPILFARIDWIFGCVLMWCSQNWSLWRTSRG